MSNWNSPMQTREVPEARASSDQWSAPVTGWDSSDAISTSPAKTTSTHSSWNAPASDGGGSETRSKTPSNSLSDGPNGKPHAQSPSLQAMREQGAPLAGYAPGSSTLSIEDAWGKFIEADKTQDMEEIKPALGAICEAMQGHDWIEIERRLRRENCKTYLVAVDQPVKSDFTLVDLKGQPDQRFRLLATFYPPGSFAYGFLGRTYPKTQEENLRRLPQSGVVRDTFRSRCWNCRDTGHTSKSCPLEKRSVEPPEYYNKCYVCGSSDHKTRLCPDVDASMTCSNCGQGGHMARECPEPRKMTCRRCGEEGHMVAECSQPRTDVTCNNCNQEGHMARECPEPRKVTCRRCNEEGHMAAECSQPRTDVTCNNCNQDGHMARDCPDPRKVTCRRCGEEGHMAAECSQPRKVSCRRCGEDGHLAPQCSQPRTDMNCFNCGSPDHRSAECSQPRVTMCRRCHKDGHLAKDCPDGRRLFGYSEGF